MVQIINKFIIIQSYDPIKFDEELPYYSLLACNSCKRMDAFKIKHNFYYKNMNNQSNYLKEIACNTCICMDTFKLNPIFI